MRERVTPIPDSLPFQQGTERDDCNYLFLPIVKGSTRQIGKLKWSCKNVLSQVMLSSN